MVLVDQKITDTSVEMAIAAPRQDIVVPPTTFVLSDVKMDLESVSPLMAHVVQRMDLLVVMVIVALLQDIADLPTIIVVRDVKMHLANVFDLYKMNWPIIFKLFEHFLYKLIRSSRF